MNRPSLEEERVANNFFANASKTENNEGLKITTFYRHTGIIIIFESTSLKLKIRIKYN